MVTKVSLDEISDIDIYNFIDHGKWGGITWHPTDGRSSTITTCRTMMRYNDTLHLLYTDTDSLVLSMETDDLYADMKQDLDVYDTSNYSEDHLYTLLRTRRSSDSPRMSCVVNQSVSLWHSAAKCTPMNVQEAAAANKPKVYNEML